MRKAPKKAYNIEIEKTGKREANPATHKVLAQQCTTNFCIMIASIDERGKAILLPKIAFQRRHSEHLFLQ